MTRFRSGYAVISACAVAFGLVACSGAQGGPVGDEAIGTTSQALTGSGAIARAQLWVTAEVPYCQSPNGQPDLDPSCASVCTRPTNAQWDPYRSDCSGFISWAWGLPAPGRTTDDFAPAVTDITEVIDGNQLEPGDALNVPGDHIILFVGWNTPGQNATFMEEPGCSANPPYAHEFTSNVEISGSSVTVDYESNTFTAIRYTGLTGAGDAGSIAAPGADAGTPCTVGGVEGVCILTSDCAGMTDHVSTPGYCPGPADIECCTSTGGNGYDAGASPPIDGGGPSPTSDAGVATAADATTTPTEDASVPSVPPSSGTPGAVSDAAAPGSGDGASRAADGGSPSAEDAPTTGSTGCSASPVRPTTGFGSGAWLAGLAVVALRRRRRGPPHA